MADQYVTIEGLNSLLLALVATQAPDPTADYLNESVTPFDGRPMTPDEDGFRAWRNTAEIGGADFARLREEDPHRADEIEAYAARLRSWSSRYKAHREACIEAARLRWRVEWATRLFAEVHRWERREF